MWLASSSCRYFRGVILSANTRSIRPAENFLYTWYLKGNKVSFKHKYNYCPSEWGRKAKGHDFFNPGYGRLRVNCSKHKSLNQLMLQGKPDKPNGIVYAKFGNDILAMRLDGAYTQEKFFSNGRTAIFPADQQ